MRADAVEAGKQPVRCVTGAAAAEAKQREGGARAAPEVGSAGGRQAGLGC